ncbi:MAG: M23 family metallopeptidase [Kangiellaceae bacterium]|nr:M23 family metallopeptidase [Kangiellaceae bacterium]MCW9000053.1 M23 family metallopeptidase [Kangiellaceae bacterium]
MKNSFLTIVGLVFSSCLISPKSHAIELELITQSPVQGSMILAKVTGEGDVYFKETRLRPTPKGIVVFGVGRDSAEQIELTLRSDAGVVKYPIQVAKRDWKIERVDGLPPSKVNPKGEAVLKRIRQEAGQVRNARAINSDATDFLMSFVMPAQGRISGVYGSQRVLNGEPKRPHFGLDVANKTGTAVIAPIDGTVSLVHQDMYYSGGTLVIDHGYGISSTYIHLNSISVKQGERVTQGQEIGTIGATGRATGPHLDWRLNWFNVRLDPQLLVPVKDEAAPVSATR